MFTKTQAGKLISFSIRSFIGTQVSHVIEVSGFSFRPIHDFVVQKQKLGFSNGEVSSYGLQRYIALAASKPTNTGYNVNKTKD